jgi:hypothetical protein
VATASNCREIVPQDSSSISASAPIAVTCLATRKHYRPITETVGLCYVNSNHPTLKYDTSATVDAVKLKDILGDIMPSVSIVIAVLLRALSLTGGGGTGMI